MTKSFTEAQTLLKNNPEAAGLFKSRKGTIMGMVQLEPIHQTTTDKFAFRNHPHHSNNFAHTLESIQNSMAEEKALSADQARMVIRMVGAAISGDFQQVSGWSGKVLGWQTISAVETSKHTTRSDASKSERWKRHWSAGTKKNHR